MVRGFKLYEVNATGGEIKPVDVRALKPGAQVWPQFLPGGDDFLFLLVPRDERGPEVYLATLRDGQVINPVMLMRNDTAATFARAAGGRLLFVRNDNLYAQKLDRRKRRLIGEAELVQQGVASLPGLNEWRACFSASRSGVIAWRPGRAALNQVTMLDRRGNQVGTVGSPGSFHTIALSPDETRLLAISDESLLFEPGQPGRVSLGTGGGLGSVVSRWISSLRSPSRPATGGAVREWRGA